MMCFAHGTHGRVTQRVFGVAVYRRRRRRRRRVQLRVMAHNAAHRKVAAAAAAQPQRGVSNMLQCFFERSVYS